MLNLDTNILIFALSGELSQAEQTVLATSRWSISSIVLWELAKLVQLGRLDLDLDDREVARVLTRLHVWQIDLANARASIALDFSSDPADELIAATSVVHDIHWSLETTRSVARNWFHWPCDAMPVTPRTADAVVIGGGVNGASIAMHLARMGAGKVLLVEKGHLASGQTARSGAMVREHYLHPVLVRMAIESAGAVP